MPITVATPVADPVPRPSRAVHRVLHDSAHEALRREFGRMPALFAASAEADLAVRLRVVSHARELIAALRTHSTLEHDLFVQQARAGSPVDHDALDRLTAQRAALEGRVVRIEGQLDGFPLLDAAALSKTFTALADAVDLHLRSEELTTVAEEQDALAVEAWSRFITRARMSVAPRRQLTWFGHLLEGVAPADRARVVETLPAPIRTVWRLAGERRFGAELAVLDAIAAGRVRRTFLGHGVHTFGTVTA